MQLNSYIMQILIFLNLLFAFLCLFLVIICIFLSYFLDFDECSHSFFSHFILFCLNFTFDCCNFACSFRSLSRIGPLSHVRFGFQRNPNKQTNKQVSVWFPVDPQNWTIHVCWSAVGNSRLCLGGGGHVRVALRWPKPSYFFRHGTGSGEGVDHLVPGL